MIILRLVFLFLDKRGHALLVLDRIASGEAILQSSAAWFFTRELQGIIPEFKIIKYPPYSQRILLTVNIPTVKYLQQFTVSLAYHNKSISRIYILIKTRTGQIFINTKFPTLEPKRLNILATNIRGVEIVSGWLKFERIYRGIPIGSLKVQSIAYNSDRISINVIHSNIIFDHEARFIIKIHHPNVYIYMTL